MKENLLPNMASIQLIDREGSEASIDIKLVVYQGVSYVFLSDSKRYGLSSIARNTANYISQIVERLGLDAKNVMFFRHIYTANSGSVFGQFFVKWQEGLINTYHFKMLNNLDQAQGISKAIDEGEHINLTGLQLKGSPTAV